MKDLLQKAGRDVLALGDVFHLSGFAVVVERNVEQRAHGVAAFVRQLHKLDMHWHIVFVKNPQGPNSVAFLRGLGPRSAAGGSADKVIPATTVLPREYFEVVTGPSPPARGYEQGNSIMTRHLGTLAALSWITLGACGPQEPAATPLAPPPVESEVAPPAAARPAEPKAAPLTAEEKAKAYHDVWAAFNARDFTKYSTLWAESATAEMLDMGPALVGPSAIIEQGVKPRTDAFPDITGEVQLTLVNGNTIAGVVLIRGTQTGTFVTPMGPVAPTSKKVGFLAAQLLEVSDEGKLVKEAMAYDGGTVAGQLGLVPMPHRKLLESGWSEKVLFVANGNELEKSNLAAVAKGFEAFNEHDAAGALATASDTLVFSEMAAPADRVGKKESRKGLEEMFRAFPDVKLNVKSSWAAGDYVVTHGTWTGTNTGDSAAMKLRKTGKAVTVQFIEIDKVVGGKTSNVWLFSNGAAAAQQLGLLPPKGVKPPGESKPSAKLPAAPPAPPTPSK